MNIFEEKKATTILGCSEFFLGKFAHNESK